MSNRKTLEEKRHKIAEIVDLIEKVACIPETVMAHADSNAICTYLVEMGAEIGKQIREASPGRCKHCW